MSVDKRTGKSTWAPATGVSQKKRRKAYTEKEKAQREGTMPAKPASGLCPICKQSAEKRGGWVWDHPGDDYSNGLKGRWICRSDNEKLQAGKK